MQGGWEGIRRKASPEMAEGSLAALLTAGQVETGTLGAGAGLLTPPSQAAAMTEDCPPSSWAVHVWAGSWREGERALGWGGG